MKDVIQNLAKDREGDRGAVESVDGINSMNRTQGTYSLTTQHFPDLTDDPVDEKQLNHKNKATTFQREKEE
jgi:hypothetical protein